MSEQNEETDIQPLVLPTDKQILTLLANGKRQTPKNVAVHLGEDTDPSYMSGRLRTLEKRGYVYSPGPADRSGMYEITSWGQIAANRIKKYNRGYDALFHTLTIRTAETQIPDTDESPPKTTDIHPNWIQLTGEEIRAFRKLVDIGGVTIPSDFPTYFDTDISADDAAEYLYTLHFYGLADRREGMDAYSPTETAKRLMEANPDIEESLQNGCQPPSTET